MYHILTCTSSILLEDLSDRLGYGHLAYQCSAILYYTINPLGNAQTFLGYFEYKEEQKFGKFGGISG